MSSSSPTVQVEGGGGEIGRASSNGGRITTELVVGYALPAKKVETFITPSLLNQTQQRGIRLLPINLSTPLLNQGPFHCIIHKLPSSSHPDWEPQLLHYASLNPHVLIIDSPRAICRLHDRRSMLRVVSDLQIPPSTTPSCSFGIPDQICLLSTNPPADLKLDFPVVAKPLASDGTANSHQMYLVFNREGLQKLGTEMEPPLVLQQFVNHGGVVFKVYVVGDHVNCVRRNSLPDYDKNDSNLSLLPFSQISNISIGESESKEDEVPMPPMSFLNDLAKGLRDGLELNLFNFDVIRDGSNSNHYYIIDINYFPGYAKMPCYETVFTDFLLHQILGSPPPATNTIGGN